MRRDLDYKKNARKQPIFKIDNRAKSATQVPLILAKVAIICGQIVLRADDMPTLLRGEFEDYSLEKDPHLRDKLFFLRKE